MSSTSLLSQGFGLTDLEYIRTEYEGGNILFHVRTKEDKLKCSECGGFDIIKKGTIVRWFRTFPIGLKPVYLKMEVQRLECKECKTIRQEHLGFVDKKKATPVDSLGM